MSTIDGSMYVEFVAFTPAVMFDVAAETDAFTAGALDGMVAWTVAEPPAGMAVAPVVVGAGVAVELLELLLPVHPSTIMATPMISRDISIRDFFIVFTL
jgi:hypothetical protein